ncbi:MAG: hypothetical protein GTO45_30700 [Candidatus Aminicenantes bacterium]|nr:hypothetical protein [Candidatus Aminicenantes bacterium]NIM83162.1 hypothetical protein [Candidatus Aminicenantes bacterium]NIN22538.1 hypothetical protein [Candidatus Aminicenantes bacterium]NIN46309.1 hypothetical protein [Candidatus Aminicenantes bacterium]NIN89148.1 hypothetical protein [Candidatus Aminicenantes bacterium]
MSIPLPNLDDRRFDDLVEELRTLIPRYVSEWTDHNLSDSGITLMELLVWLTEMTLYRLNQIPTEHYLKFLKLIGESEKEPGKAVESLWKPYRAITAADFERLAIEANPGKVARARCLFNRNLEHTTKDETGHISIIIVPDTDVIDVKPVPGSDLKGEILNYLLPRRLITTRVHVVEPTYLDISIPFQVTAKENIDQTLLEERVRQRLRVFLHPISGGIDGNGWPFGRDVVISEIYRLIEETPGVDYTAEARLIPSAQFIYLYFNTIEFEQSLPPGAYVEAEDGCTRFPIAGPVGGGDIDNVTVKGFKQGDRVKVSHLDDPYHRQWLIVESVSADNWKELRFNSFQVPKTFPAGSIISTEDGNIISTITHDIPPNQEVEKLEITGFQEGEIIGIKEADGTVVMGNIKLTGVERCTDKVFLEENWLPWYI